MREMTQVTIQTSYLLLCVITVILQLTFKKRNTNGLFRREVMKQDRDIQNSQVVEESQRTKSPLEYLNSLKS